MNIAKIASLVRSNTHSVSSPDQKVIQQDKGNNHRDDDRDENHRRQEEVTTFLIQWENGIR